MTVEELLKACSNGKMPKVIYQGEVGQVTAIRVTSHYKGCDVKFPSRQWHMWFHGKEDGKDKRSKYMKDLTFQS